MTRRFHSSFIVAVLCMACSAFAQKQTDGSGSPKVSPKLTCPEGTQRVEKVSSAGTLTSESCAKTGPNGYAVLHGPFREYGRNGKVEASGQIVDGFREGTWVFFDANGSKVGETDFRQSVYDGKRLEFYADGRLKSEQTWNAGKREGLQRSWDARGNEKVVEYRADAPVTRP